MSQIKIIQGLPFVSIKLFANSQSIDLEYVLLDTGAMSCVFKTDFLEKIGVTQLLEDRIRKMSGVGGDEYVIEKQIDSMVVGDLKVGEFTVQMGALEYSTRMDGILGSDFLLATGAKIDFKKLTISA